MSNLRVLHANLRANFSMSGLKRSLAFQLLLNNVTDMENIIDMS